MALRRVRSKSEPVFESVQSDEAIEANPDVWDVLEGDPDVGALMAASEAAMAKGVATVYETPSAGPRRSSAVSSSSDSTPDFA